MTISGWCASHGRPDQWHDECERRGVRCGCPNHANPIKTRECGKMGAPPRVLAHAAEADPSGSIDPNGGLP